MGGEVSELVFAKSGPTIILLAGLQGVGKTTVSAKLALYLKKQVHFQSSPSVDPVLAFLPQLSHAITTYVYGRRTPAFLQLPSNIKVCRVRVAC